ncbi:MAG: hypothetical protein A3A73_02830 [Omnitrophica bacterium RIFCSPLOWO2_01_FULL_50_24]|nr:MAG: hypothetical protein A3A73_02830 [Omnitrophica bacterium RIFCSPLOWO2_01_FULL_50_24]
MSFLTKQNIKHLAFIMALVVCFAAPALADVGQASTQDLAELNRELTAKISALERQIDRLEGRVGQAPSVAAVSGGEPGDGVLRVDGGDIKLTGFVDTSFNWNFQSPATGVNGNSTLRAFDDNANTFDLNNIQFDFSRPAPENGGVGFRTVFMYGSDAQVVEAVRGAGAGNDEFTIQQGYLDIKVPVGNGLTVLVGRFATLHGAEVIENYKNWNSSRSFLFNLAIPFTHVGARALYSMMDGKVTTVLGFVNGWDLTIDNNDVKDLEFQVGYAPSENFSSTVALMLGSQQLGDRDNARGLLDIVTKWKPLPESLPKLELMANFDYGWEEQIGVAAEDGLEDWIGYALYAKYDLYDWLTLAFRWEQFIDDQGSRIGSGGSRLSSMTYTADVKTYENLLTRLEYRHDFSVDKNFDSATSDDQGTLGVSLIYLFG